MFASIRSRLIVIAILTAVCIWQLIPSKVQVRKVVDGRPVDTTETLWKPALGLDLQGGMHLALELDQSRTVSSDPKRDLDLALTVLRKRIDEFGVAEPLIQKVGDERIVVELPGVRDPVRAKSVVQRTAALEFRISDKTGAFDKVIPAMDRVLRQLGVTAGPGQVEDQSAVTQLLGGDSAGARADTTTVKGGLLEALVKPSSDVGLQPMPGEYAVPEQAYVRVDSALRISEVARLMPRNVTWRWSAAALSIGAQPYRLLYILEDDVMITGESLEDAKAQLDPTTQGAIVTFQLSRSGGRTFGRKTGAHVNDYMAIILDDRVQGRPPVIQSQIGRNGQITLGNKTIQEAQDLALTLKAGALPIPLKIVEERQVGPSLGADSIRGGLTAGVVGTVIVVLIMGIYYRMSGMLAVAGLAFYILFALGGLAMVDATMTLPGLAGLVLSVGIAVDANVLIFERIREELALGKTVRLSIDEGFRHAMNAIIDTNVSTVLTALFLFQFGTGPVKGFAVTLIMGIIASMITAVFVTRTFYMIWLDRKPAMSTLSI
ncbi:MAG: protein translocase subunit SecD, partial [Gemmatimonadota bacterium]